MITLNINSLDNDVRELKNKYVDAIFDYASESIKIILKDNPDLISCTFSLHNGGFYEFQSKTCGSFDFYVEYLDENENLEIEIPNTDGEFKEYDVSNSWKYFREIVELSNNLNIIFPKIFEGNDRKIFIEAS